MVAMQWRKMDLIKDICCSTSILKGAVNGSAIAVSCPKCNRFWVGRTWEDLKTTSDCCQNWSHYDKEGNHKIDHDGRCPTASEVYETLKLAGIG